MIRKRRRVTYERWRLAYEYAFGRWVESGRHPFWERLLLGLMHIPYI